MRAAAWLVGLLLCAAPARADWVDRHCGKGKTRPFAKTVAEIIKDGEQAVLSEAFGKMISVPAPAMQRVWAPDQTPDRLARLLNVLVLPRPDGGLKSDGVIVTTLLDTGSARERWFFQLSNEGALERAMQIRDKIDEKGELVEGTEEIKHRGRYDPEVIRRFRHEQRFYCWRR